MSTRERRPPCGNVIVVRAARWDSFAELRRTFPAGDLVTVKSGRKVAVFNIGGNEFRLVCAIHFNTEMVFALRFMTHAECTLPDFYEEIGRVCINQRHPRAKRFDVHTTFCH